MAREWTYDGFDGGRRVARIWDNPRASYLALLTHGYGEHIGRYEHVAGRLLADGAAVYGVDHVGHGRSDGERVLIEDFERVVDDVHTLDLQARKEHPGLPTVLIGHSMGGLIAARYAQRYGDTLAALVLSGPVLGRWDIVPDLLAQDPIPDTPIDIATLSRDPEVGRAYDADPMIWHGPFRRPTLVALQAALDTINAAGDVGSLPLLWLHGGDDRLVPIDGSAEGIERLRGKGDGGAWQGHAGGEVKRFETETYAGAQHEIFNETNKDHVLDDLIAFLHRVLGVAL